MRGRLRREDAACEEAGPLNRCAHQGTWGRFSTGRSSGRLKTGPTFPDASSYMVRPSCATIGDQAMKRPLLLVHLLAGLALPGIGPTAFVQEPNPPAGFRAIFNGKDLTGWYGLNPHSAAQLKGEKKDTNLK